MTDQPYAAGLAPSDPHVGSGPGWVVFGAGGHARSVVNVLERLGHVVVAVVGDSGGRDWHVDRLEDEDAAIDRVLSEGLRAVVAIGAPQSRMAVLGRLRAAARSAHSTGTGTETETGARSAHSTGAETGASSSVQITPAVVAATATVAPDVELGAGTVVLEHAHIGPATRLGAGVILNTGGIVEHDCVVGDGAHIAPGAALLGAASIGAACLVGSGARILPGVSVGSGVTVGAGAVVTHDVPDGVTITGVPARAEGVHR